MIKSRRWVGYVARIGERKGYIGFGWENMRENDHLGDPAVFPREYVFLTVILRWIFRKWDVGVWT